MDWMLSGIFFDPTTQSYRVTDIYPRTPGYYSQFAHEFKHNLPNGTEWATNDRGQNAFYHPESNYFLMTEPNGTIKSLYQPTDGRPWFQKEFLDKNGKMLPGARYMGTKGNHWTQSTNKEYQGFQWFNQ